MSVSSGGRGVRVWKILRSLILIVVTLSLLAYCYYFYSINLSLQHTKSYGYRTFVRSDLRDLDVAQQNFRARTGHYASRLSDLSRWSPSTGVTLRIVAVTDTSFTVEGTHSALPGVRCPFHRVVSDTTSLPPPACILPPPRWWDFTDH